MEESDGLDGRRRLQSVREMFRLVKVGREQRGRLRTHVSWISSVSVSQCSESRRLPVSFREVMRKLQRDLVSVSCQRLLQLMDHS